MTSPTCFLGLELGTEWNPSWKSSDSSSSPSFRTSSSSLVKCRLLEILRLKTSLLPELILRLKTLHHSEFKHLWWKQMKTIPWNWFELVLVSLIIINVFQNISPLSYNLLFFNIYNNSKSCVAKICVDTPFVDMGRLPRFINMMQSFFVPRNKTAAQKTTKRGKLNGFEFFFMQTQWSLCVQCIQCSKVIPKRNLIFHTK